MDTLDFDYFFRQLHAGVNIDETCFYFSDDPREAEHYLGFLPEHTPPYWVGCCDIPDGADFQTAEELVCAPIFDGRSLKDRWAQVRIAHIEGIDLEDWLRSFPHA